MCLYFYSEQQSDSSQTLYNQLSQLMCDGEKLKIEKVSGVGSVCNLKIRAGDIVVIFADSTIELDAIISRREMFTDCRVILVLPDGDIESIHKGHMLRPRFIGYKDSCQHILFEVIRNLAAKDKTDSPYRESMLRSINC